MSDRAAIFRIGQGFDVHRFGDGDHVMLGGVRILHSRGLEAHSDGDVVIHALCDALLGALALGDIGQMFPDTDAQWQGADSLVLLEKVMARVATEGWQPGNVDITVMAQAPRLSPHVEAMRATLAGPLELEPGQVSVKATTTERLGFTGRGEGIAASAVVLLQKT